MPIDRKTQQEWQSRILNTLCVIGLAFLYIHRPEYFNPFELPSWKEWWGLLLAHRVVLLGYDYVSKIVLRWLFHNQLLPTRQDSSNPVRYVPLDRLSLLFLTINGVHEYIFTMRFLHFIWYSPNVPTALNELTLANTVVALAIIFIVMDVLYAPSHHILHLPSLYPLVHKHHHRQHYPTEGYLDAGNEHPLEHILGVHCIWGATLAAVHISGCHGLTLVSFLNIHSILAMLNHSPYHVRLRLIPGILEYSVANHEMHHRKFTVNYAQYSMAYDHLVQTFAPYEGPTKKKNGSARSTTNNSKTTLIDEDQTKKIR